MKISNPKFRNLPLTTLTRHGFEHESFNIYDFTTLKVYKDKWTIANGNSFLLGVSKVSDFSASS